MKTKSDFLNNFATNKELAKAALKQGGVSWEELKENSSDFYDASTGAVTGMVYYTDTVKFAKKHHLLILQALSEFEEECGTLKKPQPIDETNYYNWLAWFAWENTMGDLINYLEN